MKVLLAKTAGFCYGVNRAVGKATDAAAVNNKILMLGDIIHNPHVINNLKESGAEVINSVNEANKDDVVVIRSHGITRAEMEILQQKNCIIIDATCPFVKKIHNLVEKYYKKSYNIIIAGNPTHPEVIGILGWCDNKADVISDLNELKSLNIKEPLFVVSQTTFNKAKWNDIKNWLEDNVNDVYIEDTICDATASRQLEAEEIAKKCDAVVVIGGKESSNTKQLFNVASRHCKNVFLIENTEELDINSFNFNCVGVTAGASTPAYIIKEVVNMIEERELNFEEALESTLKPLNTGDIVKGTVIKITPTEVYVDLETKADGIIPVDQVSINPNANVEEILKVGQEIEAFVVRVNDVEGYVTLSMRKLESIAAQKEFNEAFENGTVLNGVVTEVVRGGIIVVALGTKVFVPASQATERYTEDLSSLLKKEVPLKIIEMDKRRRKIVGSIKTVLLAEKNAKLEAFWASVEVGKEIKGVVKSVTNFGAFVDIGGVDGLVHRSELTWQRIKHPSEIVKPGDILDVVILDFDKETKKISLGHKKSEDNPWLKVENELNVGDVIKCTIVRLLPFGAFAEIFPGVDGLIHISQIANKKIGKPADVLSVGQEVEAKVVDINNETQKIGLSMRALIEDVAPVEEPVVTAEEAEAEEPADYVEDENDATLAEVADIPVITEE